MEIMRRLFQEEEGQGLVEYVMILAIVVAIAVAVKATGLDTAINDKFDDIISELG